MASPADIYDDNLLNAEEQFQVCKNGCFMHITNILDQSDLCEQSPYLMKED